MAPTVQQVAQIYEDPEPPTPKSKKGHKRVPSVGDVLRGRRKDVSPSKADRSPQKASASPSPLGERHINSPPAPKRVPLKTDESRPPMHKKTGSTVSLKDIIMGKDKNAALDGASGPQTSPMKSPKKNKSSTNLAGLLKKRSKKDLKEDTRNQENVSPSKQQSVIRTPLWEQYATRPLEGSDGKVQYPQSQSRTLQDEIALYTPKDYSEYRPAEQRNFHGLESTPVDYKPPQRPYLEHRSSRSSIFTENLDDNDAPELKRPKSRDQSSHRPNSSRVVEQAVQTPVANDTQRKPHRASKVLDAISIFDMKSRKETPITPTDDSSLSPQELDSAFEKVLDARNIPHNMRDTMRNLKPELKTALMRGDRSGSESSTASMVLNDIRPTARSPRKTNADRPKSEDGEPKEGKRERSRSRPRSRIFTLTKRENNSPTKEEKPASSIRSRSKTRPKSVDMSAARPTSSRSLGSSSSVVSLTAGDTKATPGDFIHYLREVQKPSLVEVGKLHKLRLLLRNESVAWTDHFVTKGGMNELVQLFYRITKVEWREEHEDNLLHETLLCLKALCTTELALQKLVDIQEEFFPILLAMLFDPERKGPSEFTTRGVIVALLFAHLCSVQAAGPDQVECRASKILDFLKDPAPEAEKQTLEFVSQMHISRPYRVWCKEVVNVTKEVFWIFLHHMTVVPVIEKDQSLTFNKAHFPGTRPPHPAAPYVGGVEWDATQYLATHLDLLNGIIASLPTQHQRNQLREDLRQSGFEKVMGGSLRTCKEKFYGGVHDGLKCWVSAAKADGYYVEDVRAGPPREQSSPRKSPTKKNAEPAPKISFDMGSQALPKVDDGWI